MQAPDTNFVEKLYSYKTDWTNIIVIIVDWACCDGPERIVWECFKCHLMQHSCEGIVNQIR